MFKKLSSKEVNYKLINYTIFFPQETSCGSPDCPWLIEAGPGQAIQITVLDFNTSQIHLVERQDSTCIVIAVLKQVLHSS